MNKKNISLIISIVITLAVALSCVFILTRNKPKDLTSEKINELYSQKSKINYEIDKYRVRLEELTVTKAGLFILFENLEETLIENALPLLQENEDYKAIVKVSPDEYQNSILLDELEEQGWEFAIGFDGNYSFPESDKDAAAALEDHIGLYSENGKIPSIISFSSGNASYRRAFDEVLEKYDIKVVIAPKVFLAGGNEFLDYDHETGLLKIPCVPFSVTNTVEAIVKTHIASNKPLVLSIKHLETNVSSNSDKLSEEKFTLMLEYIEKYDKLHVGNSLSYREFIVSEHSKNIDEYTDVLKKIEECEKKIASIDKEINELMDPKK